MFGGARLSCFRVMVNYLVVWDQIKAPRGLQSKVTYHPMDVFIVVLAEFCHNRIVQSPYENYFNVCRQHKEK